MKQMGKMYVLDYIEETNMITVVELYVDYDRSQMKSYSLSDWMSGEKKAFYDKDPKHFFSGEYLDACIFYKGKINGR